jgi:hypothetical protein
MKKKIVPIVIGAVALILVLAVVLIVALNVGEKNKKEIISSATLKEIIEISELSTFEAVYNGVAQVMNEKNTDEIDYYVSYEATVKAGIDFEQITIEVDHEKKEIVVTMPEIQINDSVVDMTSLDYIFVNEKANNETVTQKAYEACKADVDNECTQEDAIYELAKQNAKNVIEALVKPFVNQMDEEYVLVIQ